MNKIRILTISVIVLFLLNAATLVYVFTRRRPPAGRPGEDAAAFIIDRLHLDTQQQQDFAELRRQHQEATRAARQEDRRLHDLYFSLLKTDQPDTAKVDSVAALIARQNEVLNTVAFTHFEKLRHLLQPDQKKLFDNIIDEIAKRTAPPPQGPRRDGPPPR